MAGFGVDYRGLHGTDERIRLDSIPAVQATSHQAWLTLLSRGAGLSLLAFWQQPFRPVPLESPPIPPPIPTCPAIHPAPS
jgi:hypothetical protein